MHAFAVVTAFFAALAFAEDVQIKGFTVRKNPDIESISFKITGDDVTDQPCSASNVKIPTEVITCGEKDTDKYRFAVETEADNSFAVRIYHETGTASGVTGTQDIATHCRAGGNGPDDQVCEANDDPATISLKA